MGGWVGGGGLGSVSSDICSVMVAGRILTGAGGCGGA